MAKRKRFSKYDNMPFSLWERKLPSGRTVYYVRFKNEDGSYKTAQSSGQTSKDAATRWAFKQIANGSVLTKRNIKFEEYTQGFFDWEGQYVTYLKQRGRQIGKTHCRHMNAYIKNHLKSYFGAKKLTSIKSLDIENWQNHMIYNTELSPRTINHMLICLRTVFKEALKHGYIEKNPCGEVVKLKEDLKERGVLTVKETVNLFKNPSIWRDQRHYLMCKLSALTGMRQGELIALKRRYVHDYYIEVMHSWESGFGLKGPKTQKSKRPVLITTKLALELKELMNTSPFQGDDEYVFYSYKQGFPITNDKAINTSLYKALEKIKIKKEERTDRHLTFHSLRHFFNTYLRNNGIPDNIIRDFLGHSTAIMTENYTHRMLDDFKDIRNLQDKLRI